MVDAWVVGFKDTLSLPATVERRFPPAHPTPLIEKKVKESLVHAERTVIMVYCYYL